MMSSSILKCISSSISIINQLIFHMDKVWERKAMEQIEYAKRYLEPSDIKEGLVRQAVQHLECAVSFLNKYPWFNKNNQIERYNDLCILIAYIHHNLGDPSSIEEYWIYHTNETIYPSSLLKEFNESAYQKLLDRYQERERLDREIEIKIDSLLKPPVNDIML